MKRISVKGYKAINKEKCIEFAPINLIIGPNGSGKSSLINTLILSKGMLKTEMRDVIHSSIRKESSRNYIPENLYSRSTYNLAVMPRLINPFDNLGKFKKSDINYNSKTKEFTVSLPIEMRHFNDLFNIEFSYILEKNNNALINGMKLVNTSRKTELFSIINTGNSSNDLSMCRIKIDTNYLIEFIKELKRKNKNFKSIKTEVDYHLNPNDISSEEMSEIYNDLEEDDSRFRKKFFTEFKKESNCSSAKNNANSIRNPSYLLEYYDKIEKLGFSNYSKIDEPGFEIKSSPELYKMALDFEKEWLNNIRNGFTFEFETPSFSLILDSFLEGHLPVLTNDYFTDKKFPEYNKLLLFNINISFSDKTDFIFNQLLFRNVNEGLKEVHKKADDILYIPPNRNRNYKVNKELSNEDIITVLISRLNNMQYEDRWAKPSEFFVNYWLSEFNLKSKVKFNSIDDIISLFDLKNKSDKDDSVDLGYGISQLIPLICLFSLFNEKYRVVSTELYIHGNIIQQVGTSNCFLIEEPEANLHPNFQSKLADLFIDANWKFGHQFIIETHSEYIVRKFQYWVAEGKIKPSDVNIYYFENKNDDPLIKDIVIKKININLDGSLSEPFGEGFFDEATNLQFELLKIKNAQKN